MKKFLLLKLLLLTAYCSFAQTTYEFIYAQNAGYPGGIRPSSSSITETSSWTTILSGTASTNAWSPTQTLPFTFNFFGTPVTSYKASANMLLTFDVANTALPSANTNLPSATLPNNTIAGFWDEFTNDAPTGSNDVVQTRVFGTTPNRQLWVEWFSFEYGNPFISYAYNAIVLEETTNKVYVVNLYNAGSPTLTTTVGLQQNSTTAIQEGTNTLPLEANINAVVSEVDYYQFTPRLLVPADASITALVAPTQPACYSATQPVEVTLKNAGTAPISNVPVAARITGGASPQTLTTTYTGPLAPNATVNVVVGNANMLAAGTYSIKAYAALANDGFRGNDTLATVTRTVLPVLTLPQLVNFTGYTGSNLPAMFTGWREAVGTVPGGTTSDEWTSSNFGNVAGKNGVSARVNIYDVGMNDWIVSPKFLATATSAVRYDLALTAYATTTASTLGSDDQFKVMVSTNCGATWTALRTYSASTPISNTGQSELVSLSNYAGQEIMIAFFATEGTVNDPEDVDLFLDNIFIGTPPALDMGAVALVSPTATACISPSQAVSVSIQNYAVTPIDFAVNPATVTVNVTGAVTQTLTTTLNTGTLAAGAVMTVSMGNLTMSAGGTYTFNSSVSVTGDGIPDNNAGLTATRTVVPIVSLPQHVNFTGFTGTNLTTLFPNWTEKSGATTPSGTTSSWTSSTGLGGTNNTTAKINLWSTGKNEWIMGPKVSPTATTSLRFRAAITDYASLTPDANGMDADDRVQVMISTDCGISFSPLHTFDATNTSTLTNVLTDQVISLANYAGQQVILAIFATEGANSGTSDYDFHIDDLYIGTVAPIDVQARELMSPVAFSGCFGTSQNVSVRIQNLGTSPLDFTTTNSTVTVTISGAATQTLTTTLNNNTLNGGTPLAPWSELVVPVGTLSMTTPGAYNFAVTATATGDGNTANDVIPAVNITANPVAAGTAAAATANVCAGSMAMLNLTGATGGDIQWQQATSATGPFTNITGATAATFTTSSGISQPTYFQAVVSCGTNTSTSNVVTVGVTNPQVTTSTGATVCSGTPATLTATPSTGATISWYSAATGGTALASGNTYSPTVTTNTTYYAEARIGGNGLTSLNAHPLTGGNGCTGGSMFNVNPVSNITLTGFDQNLNATAGTSVTVNIHYKTGSYLGSETTASAWTLHQAVTVTSAGPNAPTLIPVNALSLAGGQNYAFYIEADVSYTTITAPITYSNADLSVVVGAGLCNSFGGVNANRAWNGVIRYTAGCTSARVPVAVTVNTVATPTITAGGPIALCNGSSVVLTAASTTTGATYQWFDNGVAITGATNATHTVNTAGTFTVVATANGCASTPSAVTTVTSNTTPATPTITASGTTTICQGNTVTLTASSTTTGVTYQWFDNGTAITGATAATYAAGGAGPYTVTAIANGCTSAASAATTVTVTPGAATPTITAAGATTFCDGDSVTFTAASATAGATYQWFNNGTTITGATNAIFKAKAAGSYTVVATANGCPSAASTATTVTVNARPATPTITRSGNSGQLLTSSVATGNQWMLNGAAITGATAQTYQTTSNGNYTLVVTSANGCASDTSAVVNITNTGISNALAGMSVSVYPNPSKGKFNVKLIGYKQDAALELYSLTGQLIAKEEVKAGQEVTKVQVKNLAAGTYMLKVVSEKGVQITKLIVE